MENGDKNHFNAGGSEQTQEPEDNEASESTTQLAFNGQLTSSAAERYLNVSGSVPAPLGHCSH